MSNRRRNPKRDDNEPEVVDGTIGSKRRNIYGKRPGWTIERLNGDGVPDLLVGAETQYPVYVNGEAINGISFLAEVKGEKGRLNSNQEEWVGNWKGQVSVVRNSDQLVELGDTLLRKMNSSVKFEDDTIRAIIQDRGDKLLLEVHSKTNPRLGVSYGFLADSSEGLAVYYDGQWDTRGIEILARAILARHGEGSS